MPNCELGGTGIPPIVTHVGDFGPGRITEPGHALSTGTVYRNLTIRDNVISAPGSTLSFVSVGVTEGVVIERNRFVPLDGATRLSVSDVQVCSSLNFSASAIVIDNVCGQAHAIRPCTLSNCSFVST